MGHQTYYILVTQAKSLNCFKDVEERVSRVLHVDLQPWLQILRTAHVHFRKVLVLFCSPNFRCLIGLLECFGS